MLAFTIELAYLALGPDSSLSSSCSVPLAFWKTKYIGVDYHVYVNSLTYDPAKVNSRFYRSCFLLLREAHGSTGFANLVQQSLMYCAANG